MSNLYILEFKSAKDINALKRLKEKTIVYYAKIFKNSNSSASYSIEIEKLKELISKINFNINDLENEKKEKNKNLKNMKLSNEDSLKEEKTRIKIKPTENNKLIVLKKKLNDMNKHIINIILKMRIVGNLKEDIKKFVIDLINSFKKNDDIDGNITLFTNFLNKVSDFRDQIQLFQENNVDNFDFINISIDKFKKIILNFNNNISTEKKKQEISLKRKNSIDSIPDLSYSDNEDINLTKNNGFNEKKEIKQANDILTIHNKLKNYPITCDKDMIKKMRNIINNNIEKKKQEENIILKRKLEYYLIDDDEKISKFQKIDLNNSNIIEKPKKNLEKEIIIIDDESELEIIEPVFLNKKKNSLTTKNNNDLFISNNINSSSFSFGPNNINSSHDIINNYTSKINYTSNIDDFMDENLIENEALKDKYFEHVKINEQVIKDQIEINSDGKTSGFEEYNNSNSNEKVENIVNSISKLGENNSNTNKINDYNIIENNNEENITPIVNNNNLESNLSSDIFNEINSITNVRTGPKIKITGRKYFNTKNEINANTLKDIIAANNINNNKNNFLFKNDEKEFQKYKKRKEDSNLYTIEYFSHLTKP